MLVRLIVVIVFSMFTPALPAMADGMPIKNGRFEGKVTVLSLNKAQIKAINTTRRLILTPAQKKTLKDEAGQAANTFYTYETRKGENDCTCMAENLALRFSAKQVEIPHTYLAKEKKRPKR